MPIATVNILEGRTDQQKEILIKNVSEAISKSIDAPLSTVRVLINEIPKQHFGIAGKSAKAIGR